MKRFLMISGCMIGLVGCGHSRGEVTAILEDLSAQQAEEAEADISLPPLPESDVIDIVGSWKINMLKFFVNFDTTQSPETCSDEVFVLVTPQWVPRLLDEGGELDIVDAPLDVLIDPMCEVKNWPKKAYIATGQLTFTAGGKFTLGYQFKNSSGSFVSLGKFSEGTQGGFYKVEDNILTLSIPGGAKGLAPSSETSYQLYFLNEYPSFLYIEATDLSQAISGDFFTQIRTNK